MSTIAAHTNRSGNANALDRLVDREEVLQICYWYEGEGFGKTFNATVLGPFLNCDPRATDTALKELVADGYLEPVSTPISGYRFTDKGKKQGGRLFADGFADYQKAGHGECAAGCCDGDDHSQCGDECTLH